MNFNSSDRQTDPTRQQIDRLRRIVADIVHCCQDRTMFEARAFDLPQAEIRCLSLFMGERYLTAKEIAARLDVGKSRVTKLVDELIGRELMEKTDDPTDGRIKLLSLTRTGRAKLEQVDAFVHRVHGRVLENMEPQQRTTVLAALEQLHTAMETVREELLPKD